MKQQIPGYDLLKFIMALFVVGIHANLANAINVYNPYIGGVIGVLQELSVPGFFVISSMLFFRKCHKMGLNASGQYYWKFAKRLALVYLFYFILLSPVIIPNRGWLQAGFPNGLGLLVEDVLLRYTYPGSWFLSALIVATTIVYLLCKKINPWILLGCFLALHLYIFNVDKLPAFCHVFYDWYETHVRTIKLSFPIALVWVAMGACLASPKVLRSLPDLKKHTAIVWSVFVLSFILEYFHLLCINGLGRILMVACLIVIFYNMDLTPSPLYKKLREYSILIFFWHFIVLQIYKVIYHEAEFQVFGIWLYPMALIPVFIISSIILWLEDKRWFGWLKYSH